MDEITGGEQTIQALSQALTYVMQAKGSLIGCLDYQPDAYTRTDTLKAVSNRLMNARSGLMWALKYVKEGM